MTYRYRKIFNSLNENRHVIPIGIGYAELKFPPPFDNGTMFFSEYSTFLTPHPTGFFGCARQVPQGRHFINRML
jgi:hypothetical protein